MNYEEIRQNLQIVTGGQKPPEGTTIQEALRRLDEIAKLAELPRDLAHYLSRRSYVKALEWLDNPDMPHKA